MLFRKGLVGGPPANVGTIDANAKSNGGTKATGGTKAPAKERALPKPGAAENNNGPDGEDGAKKHPRAKGKRERKAR